MLSNSVRGLLLRTARSPIKQQQYYGFRRCLSSSVVSSIEDDADTMPSLKSFFNPTDEHCTLRSMLQTFVQREVEPQALEYNKTETFNIDLFRKLGDDGMGLLGLTVPEEYGGAGLDASAVCLVHEELSYSDPAFCLAYLAHSYVFLSLVLE